MDPEITKKPMSPMPVYSTLQELNQYAGSPNTNEPLYNVLEACDRSGAGKTDDKGPSDFQNPMYNVPQRPNPDKSSGGSLRIQTLRSVKTLVVVITRSGQQKRFYKTL